MNNHRKASFTEEKANQSSSAHNSRKGVILNYLVPAKCPNTYQHYFDTDENFKKIAEEVYTQKIKQKMQQKQKDALLFEAVIGLEAHHTIKDIENLFALFKEKFKGYTLVELAIHEDEGYFMDNRNFIFMPGIHILKKNDTWYVCGNDKEGISEADFNIKVNINEYKIVYNRHAHIKFSKINMNTGKSARLNKNMMSYRLRLVAETLDLDYIPTEKKSYRKSVSLIKADYANDREVLRQNFRLKEDLSYYKNVYFQASKKAKQLQLTINEQNRLKEEETRKLTLQIEVLKNQHIKYKNILDENEKLKQKFIQKEKKEKNIIGQYNLLVKKFNELLEVKKEIQSTIDENLQNIELLKSKSNEDLKTISSLKKELKNLKLLANSDNKIEPINNQEKEEKKIFLSDTNDKEDEENIINFKLK